MSLAERPNLPRDEPYGLKSFSAIGTSVWGYWTLR